MQVQVADVGTLRKQVSITYSPAEVAARLDKVLSTFAHQARLPGFRPGKSPKAVLAKRFGAEATDKAVEELAQEGFKSALAEHKLKPIGEMKSDEMKRDDGLSVKVSFEVRPDIVIPEPSSFSVANPEIPVDTAEVDKSIEGLARRAGAEAALTAEETLQEDDAITVSGTVTSNGKEARKLHDFHHLVGAYPFLGKAPAEVLTTVAGKKVGDAIEFSTTLPASFKPDEFANQPATVSVTIQSAKRLRPAAIDEALAKQFGYDSVEKLKGAFGDLLKRKAADAQRKTQLDQLVEQLLAKITFTLPPQLVENVTTQTVAEAVKKAETDGKTGADLDKIKADTTAEVENDLRRTLIIDALADKLEVAVTNEDLNDQINMAAAQTGRKAEDIAKNLKQSGQVGQVAREIREAKALEQFLDRVLGKVPVAAAAAAHGQPGHVHGPDCNH